MDNVLMAMTLEAVRFSDAISAKNLMACDMAIPPCFLRMVLYSIYVNFIRDEDYQSDLNHIGALLGIQEKATDMYDVAAIKFCVVNVVTDFDVYWYGGAETLNDLGFIKEMQAKKTRNFLENAYWFGMCSVYEPNHVAAR
uniref:Uncharacterized protein n=1 Tax=Tanacetum cinerariifolium TaxID=118510 RepID=A0A699JDP3_TANCI|nr:hypothetical protein [Tanacetum cinerariifolium]